MTTSGKADHALKALLKEKLREALAAVLPITLIVLTLSVLFIPLEAGTVLLFLGGAVMLVLGMGLFQLGAEMSMTALGRGVGAASAESGRVARLLALGLAMGVIVTVAEPDLLVLAGQVPAVPDRVLILTVAVGVGLFLAVAMLRILLRIPLSLLLIVLYTLLLAASFFIPREFLAVAFDSGGVTTGPITVPFIMAMGVGLASVRGDRSAADDSFGLVALSSVGPILAVMVLGCIYRPDGVQVTDAVIPTVRTTRDVLRELMRQMPDYGKEVLLSLLPILGVFFIFQLCTRRFHHNHFLRMLVGFGYTLLGLVLFLCGVSVGFSPVGTLLGSRLAASGWRWLLIPVGMLIGYYIVKAEPAIQVLNHQVETVTNGLIRAQEMNRYLSVGVSVSVGLAMLRVLTGLSLHWIVVPGYAAALVLSCLTPPMFVGIAFDSGGVASGPMTTTFLLPLAIGACQALGGSVLSDAFGVVALVALTPLIAVQVMGLRYQRRVTQLEQAAGLQTASPHRLHRPVELELAQLEDPDAIVELR